MLSLVNETTYTKPVPEVFNATIGGHFRHVLDHFQIVLDALETRTLDYSRRPREQAIETSPARALDRTRDLADRFAGIEATAMARPIQVTDTLSEENDSPTAIFSSSIARETLYAVHHAIHHFAMIRVMGQLMDVRFPEDFGVAISTLRHRRHNGDLRRDQSSG